MSTELEIRERQKNHLQELLELKKENEGMVVKGLDKALKRAVAGMSQEDIAWIEKLAGIGVFD